MLHRRLRIAAGLLRPCQAVLLGGGLHCLQLPTQFSPLAGELVAPLLQLLGILGLFLRLTGQLPSLRLLARQFRLHGQQLVFPEGLHGGLQLLQGPGRTLDFLPR
jgi:hypothetical protein